MAMQGWNHMHMGVIYLHLILNVAKLSCTDFTEPYFPSPPSFVIKTMVWILTDLARKWSNTIIPWRFQCIRLPQMLPKPIFYKLTHPMITTHNILMLYICSAQLPIDKHKKQGKNMKKIEYKWKKRNEPTIAKVSCYNQRAQIGERKTSRFKTKKRHKAEISNN